MKKNTQKIENKTLIIGLSCLIVGFLLSYFLMQSKVNYQKALTKKILNNSLKSMTAFKEIADSCSSAYNTATRCVSNLSSCDIELETKRLDKYNAQRINADQKINLANEELQKIISEVSTKR